MTFLRIVDGKIVEHWGLLDMPTLLQQIDPE
jgi:predicted ester cyclase